jgi:hypothetical protein
VSVIDALGQALHDAAALVVVEDIHWADGASLGLLRAVVDALPGLPVLLVMTCRDDPLEPAVAGHAAAAVAIAGPVAAFFGGPAVRGDADALGGPQS